MENQDLQTVSWRKVIKRCPSTQDPQIQKLDPNKVYRVKRMSFDCYIGYPTDYDLGLFLHVRLLNSTPDRYGCYEFTTRGKDGEHLGPGGGWSDESVLYLKPSHLEMITDVTITEPSTAA